MTLRTLTRVTAPVLALTLTAGSATAGIHVFNISVINGSQETPAVVSAGSGQATVTVDARANPLPGAGSHTGLSRHRHKPHTPRPAPVGTPAGVLIGLTHTGGTSGTISLTNGAITPAAVTAILSGNSYINIHSTAHGGGEIRGQIYHEPEEFCYGNGGVAGCTPCPCANDAPPATSTGGCLNPAGGSAHLQWSGLPSAGVDSLRFEVTSASPTTFGVLISGDNRLPAAGPCPPGSGIQSATLDGLRCVGGAALRHGSRATDANGDIGVTNNGWGPPSGPPGGLIASGGFAAGQVRQFQCFYRVLPTQGCGTGQNTTNGVGVTFIP